MKGAASGSDIDWGFDTAQTVGMPCGSFHMSQGLQSTLPASSVSYTIWAAGVCVRLASMACAASTLIDFHCQVLTELAGTMGYMAPEVLRRSYNEQADVWSTGVMLYEMICGQLPFNLGNTCEEVGALCQQVCIHAFYQCVYAVLPS